MHIFRLYIVRSNDLIYKFTGSLQTGIGSMLVYMYLYDVSLLPECYVCSSIVYQDYNLNAKDLASIVILVCSTFKQTIDNLLHIKLNSSSVSPILWKSIILLNLENKIFPLFALSFIKILLYLKNEV